MSAFMRVMAEELLEITEGCRGSMHEPDEQELELAGITGTKLGNDFGTTVRERAVYEGYQEVVFSLRRTLYEESGSWKEEKLVSFNLTNLIALARIGAVKVLEETEDR